MRRRVLWILVAALAFSSVAAFAQTKPQAPPKPAAGLAAETSELWNGVGRKLIEMAEDFPEDKYDYRPSKEVRTFAELLLHVAGVNYMLVNAVKGASLGPAEEDPPRQNYKTKADVVALVKKSFADGAAVIKEKGDAGLTQAVRFPFGNRMVSAQFCLTDAAEHAGEHYGNLVVYYRLNGQVPPASRPR